MGDRCAHLGNPMLEGLLQELCRVSNVDMRSRLFQLPYKPWLGVSNENPALMTIKNGSSAPRKQYRQILWPTSAKVPSSIPFQPSVFPVFLGRNPGLAQE